MADRMFGTSIGDAIANIFGEATTRSGVVEDWSPGPTIYGKSFQDRRRSMEEADRFIAMSNAQVPDPVVEAEVMAEPTNPALDFWMNRGPQTLQEAADDIQYEVLGYRPNVDEIYGLPETSRREQRARDAFADRNQAGQDAYRRFQENRALQEIDAKRDKITDEVIRSKLDAGEEHLSADWDRIITSEAELEADVDRGDDEIIDAWKSLRTPDQTAESDAAQIVLISLEGDTSEAAETIKKQAKKEVKSFISPPDFYDDPFHVPTMVQDLAADVVTGPSEPPEIVPTFPPAPMWPPVEAVEEEVVPDTRFDMFGQGDDFGMVDPNQFYPPSVRLGAPGPVTFGDPVNEAVPDALPFDDFGMVPDQNTWKEGYFPPDTNIEEEDTPGAYPVGPQDPTAAPVFPTQVGEDADPILPQDYPPFGEFGLDKPGAADFLGVEEEEVVTEEALPVEEEIIEPTWKDDYVPPLQTGGDAGEFEGLWDVPPAEADAPITPEMIEQGPWQKTQMGFFAKDYRPSDLELDDQGQPITRPAGFFGDPVPPVSVTPPPWLNPDDEAALEADVAREDEEEVVDVTAAAEEEQVDLDEDAEVAAVIDDEEAQVEVEEPVVVDTELEVQRSIEMLDAYLSGPEKIRQKEFIKSLVGDDVYARVISLEYSDDDIKKFYDELKDFKKKIQESDRKHNTNLWNMIESIYRIVVKGELG